MCRRLREHLTCPILFHRTSGDVDALEGFEAGADDYVLKPFRLARLERRRRILPATPPARARRSTLRRRHRHDYRSRTVTAADGRWS
ncbi:MAG: hypothetical protein ACLT98_03475 [Eggerthellaceae bacterium]